MQFIQSKPLKLEVSSIWCRLQRLVSWFRSLCTDLFRLWYLIVLIQTTKHNNFHFSQCTMLIFELPCFCSSSSSSPQFGFHNDFSCHAVTDGTRISLAAFSHTPSFQVTRVEKLWGSVGKTIEAFHGAQAATLSAKHFKTMTLKISFHNCSPLQQQTESCPFLKTLAEIMIKHHPKAEQRLSFCDWCRQTNCENLSNCFARDSARQSFTKCFCPLSSMMFANTLRQTDRKMLGGKLWARPDLLAWLSYPKCLLVMK